MPRVATTPAQKAALEPQGRRHELKTWPGYWDAVRHGTKTFEVRRDDRGFEVGDVLELVRWNPATKKVEPVEGGDVTSSVIEATVSYILRDLPAGFGIEPGFVVLGLGRRRCIWEE